MDFLLEIGTEELPADFVDSAIEQLREKVSKSLEAESLTSASIEIYGTPRRLAVSIAGLPGQQADRTEEIKGPPASTAYKDGKPTPAAEGFARKQGVSIDSFVLRDTDKGQFVFIEKKIPGRATQEILQELIPRWIGKLEGRRFMRWGDGDLRFPRPIRWLVSLLDADVLPIELINGSTALQGDRLTRGHRILHPESAAIPDAKAYLSTLRSIYVEADPGQRRQSIESQVNALAGEIGGKAEISEDLLAEVTNLVEYPTAIVGKFDDEFLELPPEVIITVMVTHQRYFAVKTSEGLSASFIAISNGDPAKKAIISAGNERVIRARLADARFFYQADRDEPLESFLPQLETVTFQEELGTMRDKVDRIMEIAGSIADQLRLDEKQRSDVESTAMLCKADLVTQMVYEFPELQGVMGEKYALASGEPEIVARGIFEHYLPRGAGDVYPSTITGRVVGIADRLDTLVGIFGLGMIPTGSSDPFALRRAANAIIGITWDAGLAIDLAALIDQTATDFVTAHPDKESPAPAIYSFFQQRLETLLADELSIDRDLVKAVVGENDPEYARRALQDLLDTRDRALFLSAIREDGRLETIYETVNRSTRLAEKGDLDTITLDPTGLVEPGLFEKSSEGAFYNEIVFLVPETRAARAERDYQRLVSGLAKIAPVVAEFFDGENSVLVMAEDADIRRNRLNLLGLLRNHARVLADFGAIVKG
ncbi:glycine--tRNA ligase subunit beta [Pannus brasiliensis CCIBt3594]|uniref:Glycine--tRNA ligase beta subunit n=1 Tax=Pannus brasiliensis CCIBt3594 TaxID=1427578 RepID=A0AAW9QX65_9CHRO